MSPITRVVGVYTIVKAGFMAFGRITLGLGALWVAWPFCRWGFGWLAGENTPVWRVALGLLGWGSVPFSIVGVAIGLICLALGVWLGLFGLRQIFEALTVLTPRQISEAQGQARFANRRDLRRKRII